MSRGACIDRRTFLKGTAVAGATLVVGGFTGCASGQGSASSTSSQAKTASFGRADNEIFTYTKPDPNKTQLVLSVTGVIAPDALIDVFERNHPDVQVVAIDLTGGNPKVRPYLDWVRNGFAPDVMMSGGDAPINDAALFENLTDKSYTEYFDTETILDYAVDGRIYFLPGPRRPEAIAYNKTLFAQHGWAPPKTSAELLALCSTIAADTGGAVVPINLNAKYENELTACLEGMTYPQILGGVSNRTWLHDFKAGTATFAGHMEPLFDLAKKFADIGMLTAASFDYSATTRMNEFKSGKLAMINYDLSDMPTSSDFTFGAVPFPGETADDGYLYMMPSYWTAIPKKDRTDAQRKATEEFVDFVSSEEGQEAYIAGKPLIATTAGAKAPTSEVFSELESATAAGHIFAPEYFYLDGISEGDFTGATHVRTAIQAMVTGKQTEAAAIKFVDDAAASVRAGVAPEASVGTVAENFTILEASTMFADMFKEKAGSDIALVLDNVIYRGNVCRMFSGGLTAAAVTYLKPRSFDNGATLVKANMTGAQLKAALNDPLGKSGSAECVYAFAGLKATVAPWAAAGSKMQSVALADGGEVQDDATYAVAFWNGTVNTRYYDEAAAQKITGTFEDVLKAYLDEKGPVSPSKDGRITLVWD